MLNWLRRRIAARQTRTFQYWDGHRLQSVDPITVLRDLRAHSDFNWQKDPELAEAGDEPAFARCIAATREIFGIEAWDGRAGLTEDQTWSVLLSFAGYLMQQKKSGSLPPSGQPLTEPQDSATSDTRADSV